MAQVDHHSDKNLSFWLNLLLLLAILLAALSLLYCCCYHQYLRVTSQDKSRRVENKRIQATSPASHSGEPAGNEPRRVYVLSERPNTPRRAPRNTCARTAVVKKRWTSAAESLLLEDVEGNEYRILDKRRSWSETPGTRQEVFYRQGDAEILRIVSNDSLEAMDSASNVQGVLDESAGKKAIMDKFLDSRPDDRRGGDAGGAAGAAAAPENTTRAAAGGVKADDTGEERKAFQGDALLTKYLADEQQKLLTVLETRSLPGASMATQTEAHAATQTTSSCLRARGCVRRSRSYEDDSCCGGGSRSAPRHPRRSSSLPRRRQLFNSPIMEETGSGSGASSGPRSSVASLRSGTAGAAPPKPRAPQSVTSAAADARKSRSYSCLRELELDRQLQYMTPSLRSRALARRRLSASLPPSTGRRGRADRMLEKKSVFTIAYGHAAAPKIVCSADSTSNCSNWD